MEFVSRWGGSPDAALASAVWARQSRPMSPCDGVCLPLGLVTRRGLGFGELAEAVLAQWGYAMEFVSRWGGSPDAALASASWARRSWP
jgi:hypothetical protein